MSSGPPFDTLTKQQRVPVLRAVARRVLRDDYGIEPVRLRTLSLTFNTLFRVDRDDGPPLVVRTCGRDRIHAAGVERVEAAWLDRIADDLGWAVPRCVPARDGRVVVEATDPRVPRPVPCSLFTWVPGRPVEDRCDDATGAALGGLLAQLHRHAAGLAERSEGPMAPDVMTASMAASIRADRAVSFGDPAAIVALDGGDRGLLVAAVERGDGFLAALWATSGRPHLLHGDYGPSNVLRWRNRLTPIDVQDLRLGHAVQDVGLAIADLLDDVADDDADPSVVDAFRRGYEAAGGVAITDDEIAACSALRSLSLIGFCLAAPRPGLQPTIDRAVATVAAWMRGA